MKPRFVSNSIIFALFSFTLTCSGTSLGSLTLKIEVAGLQDGPFTVQWWDTLSGKRVAELDTIVTNSAVQLQPPGFQVDIAARLKRR